MTRLKEQLVAGVARRHGRQAAQQVTADKRIGPGFVIETFSGFIDAADVEGLQRVLSGAAAGILPELDELTVLSATLRAATPRNPEYDHPLLDTVVDRLIAIDPTTDRATMRRRDGELFALWPAIGEQKTLDRIRKAVRTPAYRRDLTVLPRDLQPPRMS
ncbi:hypothetical protein ACFXHA_17695 [Nocardia sp. NPDC059240]|uniref:hypothetical protein n=1 Tax=Nocardia sp. NPDC059240 TaxID=3346786 RepID=UPI003679DE97